MKEEKEKNLETAFRLLEYVLSLVDSPLGSRGVSLGVAQGGGSLRPGKPGGSWKQPMVRQPGKINLGGCLGPRGDLVSLGYLPNLNATPSNP